ncbi:MAG TPA: redox-regulated ATPase YchF [Planctomycetota bacterium]|nr:redox-regulated ATPase YchF [Planctomycetota bacterium]
MALSCGIVGLPNVGKSTIYNALTNAGAQSANYMFSTTEANKAIVPVPDTRLKRICEFIHSDKLVYAQVEFVDVPGLVSGSSKGEGRGNSFLGDLKNVSAILHVVRCFDSDSITHVHNKVDPVSDLEEVALELCMADLATVERNIDRLNKMARSGNKDAQVGVEALKKAQTHLQAGKVLRSLTWNDAEKKALYPLFPLTNIPELIVCNVAVDQTGWKSKHAQAVQAYAKEHGSEVIEICGDVEAEASAFPEEERLALLKDMGLAEPGLNRLIQTAFKLLGLQTFLTAGEIEIKAWTIRKGAKGPEAAGAIHSDFEKGFVRAEIFSFDDLMQYKSEAAIKAAGKLRVEGKEYVMQDGDIVHFLINK